MTVSLSTLDGYKQMALLNLAGVNVNARDINISITCDADRVDVLEQLN